MVTTIEQLEKELAQILENANQHHAAALAYYPDEVYKIYDAQAVELRKKYAQLSNIADIKYIESGANSIDKELQYLEARASELEHFYFNASNSDKDNIEKTLLEIKSNIWVLKKKKKSLLTEPITLGN